MIGAPPGVEYPQTPAEQAAYEYEIRAGDFTGNGRVDLLVDRTTVGAMDGSQTFVLHQNLNGSLSLVAPSAAQLAHARTFPLEPIINMVPGDMNGDSYVDHTLQNLSQVMGSSVTDEYLVFAPGSTGWPGAPIAIRAIDDDVKSFVDDLGRWFNDANYFTENAEVTLIPRTRLGYRCGVVWHYDEVGLRPSIQCGWGLVIVGWRVVFTGVNLNALVAAAHIQTVFEDLVDVDLSDVDLWQLSQVFKAMFGVQAFGFADNGVRYPTNHGGDSPVEERESALGAALETWGRAVYNRSIALQNRWHDYNYESEICQQGTPGCTLENIACWGRRYPAPFLLSSNHNSEANHSQLYLLRPRADPIRVYIGGMGGLDNPLPGNAIANVAQWSHTFYRSSNPTPPVCSKPMPGDWQGEQPSEWRPGSFESWNECDQVYRGPAELDGSIVLRTRGWGMNRLAALNEQMGPRIFSRLDSRMIDAILDAPGGSCTAH